MMMTMTKRREMYTKAGVFGRVVSKIMIRREKKERKQKNKYHNG